MSGYIAGIEGSRNLRISSHFDVCCFQESQVLQVLVRSWLQQDETVRELVECEHFSFDFLPTHTASRLATCI